MKTITRRLSFRLRYIFFYFFLTLASTLTFSFFCSAAQWQELKGDHFIVYFKNDESFARDVLRKSEHYYTNVAEDLGYARHSNFWQWDKRVKIYIYPDQSAFLSATGQPGWSVGHADYLKKEINSFSGSSEFLISTLPHEITHLVFRDFVGFKGEVPLWLDEGVAQWEELPKRDIVKYLTRVLFDQCKLVPLKDFMHIDVRRVPRAKDAENFYVQAASLVGFLKEKYGTDAFVNFCRQLRDGKSLEESLMFTYPVQVPNLEALESQWKEYVSQENFSGQRHVYRDGKKVVEVERL